MVRRKPYTKVDKTNQQVAHVAPLGLMGWFCYVFYTHIAPLGLCWFIGAIMDF